MKTVVFTIRLTKEQKQRLIAIAERSQKKASEFVRDLVLQEIGRRETEAA
jgi:predicted transcriptional regulator